MARKSTLMILTVIEINALSNKLERGDKKRLASFIGVHENTLPRYFRFRKDLDGWGWPRDKYLKALEFINQL